MLRSRYVQSLFPHQFWISHLAIRRQKNRVSRRVSNRKKKKTGRRRFIKTDIYRCASFWLVFHSSVTKEPRSKANECREMFLMMQRAQRSGIVQFAFRFFDRFSAAHDSAKRGHRMLKTILIRLMDTAGYTSNRRVDIKGVIQLKTKWMWTIVFVCWARPGTSIHQRKTCPKKKIC